ncbi:MAG TPA: hypothetical protein VJN92_08295 [Candidatus Acidoferrum sp.]|nr:hypothetical protein [Candidatus Acidoferrum sp.]
MNRKLSFLTLLALIGCFTVLSELLAGNAEPVYAGLTVHEWGTITSIAGGDGQAVSWSPDRLDGFARLCRALSHTGVQAGPARHRSDGDAGALLLRFARGERFGESGLLEKYGRFLEPILQTMTATDPDRSRTQKLIAYLNAVYSAQLVQARGQR